MVEPRVAHCWEIMMFIRKMQSTTPSQGELANIPIAELLSLPKIDISTIEDAGWMTTSLGKVDRLSELLEGGTFPFQREGSLDNVHHHLAMAAPSLWDLLHKLHLCDIMDDNTKIDSGIKQVTAAAAEVNLAVSIIQREAPLSTLTKKIVAMSETLSAKRQSIILKIVDQLSTNVEAAQKIVVNGMANLPIPEDQVITLATSDVPLAEADKATLFKASQSVNVSSFTHISSNVKVTTS